MSGAVILSPWDQAPFFQPIRETTYSNLTVVTSVAKADPQRIALLFCNVLGSQINISTSRILDNNTGIPILGSVVPLMLLHKDFGPLVQAEWFAFDASLPCALTVIEVLLSKWPGQS